MNSPFWDRVISEITRFMECSRPIQGPPCGKPLAIGSNKSGLVKFPVWRRRDICNPPVHGPLTVDNWPTAWQTCSHRMEQIWASRIPHVATRGYMQSPGSWPAHGRPRSCPVAHLSPLDGTDLGRLNTPYQDGGISEIHRFMAVS